MDNFDKIKRLIDKTVSSVKNTSTQYEESYQIIFTDGSILLIKSEPEGYEIEYAGLEIVVASDDEILT